VIVFIQLVSVLRLRFCGTAVTLLGIAFYELLSGTGLASSLLPFCLLSCTVLPFVFVFYWIWFHGLIWTTKVLWHCFHSAFSVLRLRFCGAGVTFLDIAFCELLF
jgi:hypothetical protein